MSTAMASDDVVFSEKMEAHRLRQIEKDQIHSKVLANGAKWGTIMCTSFLGASMLAQQYLPLYRRQTFAFKAFVVTSAAMGGFFTGTDREAMRADREFAQKFSITKEDESALIRESKQARSWESFRATLYRNRFEILAASYFTVLGGTLAYNFARKDIFTSQKFINARMTAQTGAIIGVGAIAALSATNSRDKMIDPYYERVVSGK